MKDELLKVHPAFWLYFRAGVFIKEMSSLDNAKTIISVRIAGSNKTGNQRNWL
jgi:hypothetical protein